MIEEGKEREEKKKDKRQERKKVCMCVLIVKEGDFHSNLEVHL